MCMVIARQPFVENGYLSLRFPNMVKVNIFTSIERELHVSTPYEFLQELTSDLATYVSALKQSEIRIV